MKHAGKKLIGFVVTSIVILARREVADVLVGTLQDGRFPAIRREGFSLNNKDCGTMGQTIPAWWDHHNTTQGVRFLALGSILAKHAGKVGRSPTCILPGQSIAAKLDNTGFS
jgi:hypothetical protein